MPLKDTLRELLSRGALEQVAEEAQGRKRVLGSLVSLTFDANPLIGWRAVEAMGLACDRIAVQDPDHVRQHVRRLYWLISEESGGICWRAPEAMAEIVRHRPKLLNDWVPVIGNLLNEMAEEDLQHFRAGILWAIGSLGEVCKGAVDGVMRPITAALGNEDPHVRGMAVRCLSAIGRGGEVAARPHLTVDEGPLQVYENRELSATSVGNLARRAVGSPGGNGQDTVGGTDA